MWKNLSVSDLGASASYQSTLRSLINPLNKMEVISSIWHLPAKNILTGFEGAVRPGKMMRKFSSSCDLSLGVDHCQLCLATQAGISVFDDVLIYRDRIDPMVPRKSGRIDPTSSRF